jgi:hypothetical protein
MKKSPVGFILLVEFLCTMPDDVEHRYELLKGDRSHTPLESFTLTDNVDGSSFDQYIGWNVDRAEAELAVAYLTSKKFVGIAPEFVGFYSITPEN